MNLTLQKLTLHLLKNYQDQNWLGDDMDAFYQALFSRDELLDIITHIYGIGCFTKEATDNFSDSELFNLIKENKHFLSYLIEVLSMNIAVTPVTTQQEVSDFFKKIHFHMHYLVTKPVEHWDMYDRKQYFALNQRAGLNDN